MVEFSENEDYISDMECGKDDRILLAARYIIVEINILIYTMLDACSSKSPS